MGIILNMAKTVVTSKSFGVLVSIIGGYLLIRWYCLILRKLNSKRGY